MKPYLAIIKDSFREALASRVLWILLILITVILAGLAPFGLQSELAYQIFERDLRRTSELGERLSKTSRLARDPVVDHVRSLLSEELRSRLAEAAKNDGNAFNRGLRDKLTEELTSLMDRDDFYRPDAWSGLDLGDEASRLAALGARKTQTQLRRLNRLALEAAFPRNIRRADAESTRLTYAGRDMGFPTMPGKYVDQIIKRTLAGFTSFFVGQLGVFAAVLVTASIIPNTFDAGSVLLLLSKPISRPLLYLAKFVGGCSFVLINSAYLVSGLWLLVGARLGIWQHRLLLCIPVFLFLFAVYYSVSGFVGLVWRNTIVCIAVTVLFWFVCSVFGSAKFMIDMFVHDPNRFNQLVSIGDELLVTTNSGGLLRWDSNASDWQLLSEGSPLSGPGPRLAGTPSLIAVHGKQRLVKINGRRITTREAGLSWAETDAGTLSDDAQAIVRESDGRVLVISSSTAFRLSDDLKPAEPPPNLFGFEIPIPRSETNYKKIDIGLSNVARAEFSVAANSQHGTLICWRDGKLSTFQKNESGYARLNQQTIVASRQNGVVASAGELVLLALDNGQIQTFDHSRLELKNTYQPFEKNQPRFAAASADGSYFAVVFHSGQVCLIDGTTGRQLESSVLGGKGTTCARFVADTKLLVADRGRRVRSIDLPAGRVEQVWRGRRTLMESVSRFAIDPIYQVFPKPGRLDETVRYILTGRETIETNSFGDDLASTQLRLDPWSPVYSSLAFTIVMLVVSCVYITRQEY